MELADQTTGLDFNSSRNPTREEPVRFPTVQGTKRNAHSGLNKGYQTVSGIKKINVRPPQIGQRMISTGHGNFGHDFGTDNPHQQSNKGLTVPVSASSKGLNDPISVRADAPSTEMQGTSDNRQVNESNQSCLNIIAKKRPPPMNIGHNSDGIEPSRKVLYRNFHLVGQQIYLVEISRNQKKVFILLFPNFERPDQYI